MMLRTMFTELAMIVAVRWAGSRFEVQTALDRLRGTSAWSVPA